MLIILIVTHIIQIMIYCRQERFGGRDMVQLRGLQGKSRGLSVTDEISAQPTSTSSETWFSRATCRGKSRGFGSELEVGAGFREPPSSPSQADLFCTAPRCSRICVQILSVFRGVGAAAPLSHCAAVRCCARLRARA